MKERILVLDDDAARMLHDVCDLVNSGWRLVGLVTRQRIRGEVIYSATLER